MWGIEDKNLRFLTMVGDSEHASNPYEGGYLRSILRGFFNSNGCPSHILQPINNLFRMGSIDIKSHRKLESKLDISTGDPQTVTFCSKNRGILGSQNRPLRG